MQLSVSHIHSFLSCHGPASGLVIALVDAFFFPLFILFYLILYFNAQAFASY